MGVPCKASTRWRLAPNFPGSTTAIRRRIAAFTGVFRGRPGISPGNRGTPGRCGQFDTWFFTPPLAEQEKTLIRRFPPRAGPFRALTPDSRWHPGVPRPNSKHNGEIPGKASSRWRIAPNFPGITPDGLQKPSREGARSLPRSISRRDSRGQ